MEKKLKYIFSKISIEIPIIDKNLLSLHYRKRGLVCQGNLDHKMCSPDGGVDIYHWHEMRLLRIEVLRFG
jgi:hypothetical protein